MNERFGDYRQVGYPVMVRLVEEMAKKIGNEELPERGYAL